jgi:hypothetical protein
LSYPKQQKQIIKIRVQINEIEIPKTKESTKQKAGSLKKINKIDRPLT